ncbi:MAG: hypothetical protein ACQESX_11560 [Bacteroidota bacterium]
MKRVTMGFLRRYKLQSLLLPVLALVLFSSCSVERRLAREFVDQQDRPPVILKEPPQFYLVSYKETEQDTSGLKTWQVDSIRYHESEIVQYVNPDSAQKFFFNAFEKQLEKLDFTVYKGNEIAELISNDTLQPLVMRFPQMELEEFTKPYAHEEFIRGKKYYKNFDLDAVNLNSWLQLSRRGVEGSEFYFISDSITDVVDGHFYITERTGKVKFRYKYYDVKTDDIYSFMQDMGRNYAQYVFDHYLNRFVDANRNKSAQREFLYHYDPVEDDFMLIRQLPWIEMQREDLAP